LGAVPVARALERIEPWGYGVAAVEEARELRAGGIDRPVLLFTPALGSWLPALRASDVRPVLSDLDSLRQWLAESGGAPFHVSIDTGMARGGFRHADRALLAELARELDGAKGYEGICTHFHSADSDPVATDRCWEDFEAVIRALGQRPPLVHAANSAAAMAGTRYAADMVRPGIYLYGGRAGTTMPSVVATLRCSVVAVQRLAAGDPVSYGATWRAPGTVTLATLGIGYADGLPRSFGASGRVRLGGVDAPVRGRITMDMTDVEAQPGARAGDTAVVFGAELPLDEQAACAGTISYELLTSLGKRVERRYHGAEA